MYEEKKYVRKNVKWTSVFLKLLLLFLVIFLIWFIAIKIKNHASEGKNKSDNGNSMSENLNYLKKQYIKYFNEDNIPKYVNAKVRVPLSDLIEAKASKEIYDKNKVKCSSTSSYGQLMKIDNTNYNLKVYLKCKNEADSILVTITKDEILNNKIKTKKTTNNNNTNNTNNSNNTNNTTNTNNTNNTTNTNNTSNSNNTTNTTTTNTTKKTTTTSNSGSSSSRTSSSSSSSSSSSKTSYSSSSSSSSSYSYSQSSSGSSTSSSTSTTVTKTTTGKDNGNGTVTITETTTDSNGNTSSTSTTVPVNEIETEQRYVYTEYQLYKLGDAQTTKPNGNYIPYNYTVKYYKYCINKDMYNCDRKIAKVAQNKNLIDSLLAQGYQEIFDYEDTITLYIPILDEVWSRTKEKAGYTYSGHYRNHYAAVK